MVLPHARRKEQFPVLPRALLRLPTGDRNDFLTKLCYQNFPHTRTATPHSRHYPRSPSSQHHRTSRSAPIRYLLDAGENLCPLVSGDSRGQSSQRGSRCCYVIQDVCLYAKNPQYRCPSGLAELTPPGLTPAVVLLALPGDSRSPSPQRG